MRSKFNRVQEWYDNLTPEDDEEWGEGEAGEDETEEEQGAGEDQEAGEEQISPTERRAVSPTREQLRKMAQRLRSTRLRDREERNP